MVTTLYLIRHGETEGGSAKRYKGRIDVPLSNDGIEQVRDATVFISNVVKRRNGEAERADISDPSISRFSDSGLSVVYCSPLSRAMKSAEIIGEPFGLKPVIVPDLRERDFGAWEGMTFTEIKAKYPEAFDAWIRNPMEFTPMGGESTIEVRNRIIPVLEGLISSHAGQQIAIVAHGGVNRIIICQVLGIPLDNIFRIEQDYTAINIIEFWDEYPVVKLVNGGTIG